MNRTPTFCRLFRYKEKLEDVTIEGFTVDKTRERKVYEKIKDKREKKGTG